MKNIVQKVNPNQKLKSAPSKSSIESPRSYRLDNETMKILQETLARVNQHAPRVISEARLIRALIALSPDLEIDKLLKAVKEVW